ncbi:Predicted secreted hydrolase [Desulfacinum hydrothermale DSM 13146]|uniref:Predicted secreted hydrolase n=1 Tax=Desulfacinum hydrothermale DSM 13146 TaxID=1121390 RepID=A0A1W1X9N8_9BACT|nr:lipocalin-like domain-containing protein [Desulfacinum hydrothermale]SMC20231.1 Predicted secreted hydrolase [Desulfacinum hydrothermale DSM 13146]
MAIKGRLVLTLILIVVFCAFPEAGAESDGSSDYRAVTGPCAFQFPRDHGPHADYRTEWWYYTGNVTSEDGRDYGFQFTFFRNRLISDAAKRRWPGPWSRWRSDTLILLHMAVSDLTQGRFVHHRDAARAVPGMAGAGIRDGRVRIFLKKSELILQGEEHRLQGSGDDMELKLVAVPQKSPVFHGKNGYSKKGNAPERASCYYSFTRMGVSGILEVAGRRVRVTGSAWMDHEYSTSPLERGIVGWDWFSLQLSDRTELMLYQLRRADGSVHPVSQGTLVRPDGSKKNLQKADFEVRVLDHWTSPRSGATYPSGWRIRVAAQDLDLTVSPRLKDQEMAGEGLDGIDYWEGSVSVRGRGGVDGREVSGLGYVELTGYAGPVFALQPEPMDESGP